MRTRSLLLVTVLVALSFSLAPAATVRYVPEVYPTIQAAINVASDGDVISVWGPPLGQSAPPYIYHENVNFNNLNLVVASRCFLPGWTGCTPTWDSVVIDGQQLGPVVTMTGATSSVLEGFTIQHGRNSSGYGGGVSCNAGAILKNHILNNYAGLGGGGVFFGEFVGACAIHDNWIEKDTAPGGGGGILIGAGTSASGGMSSETTRQIAAGASSGTILLCLARPLRSRTPTSRTT